MEIKLSQAQSKRNKSRPNKASSKTAKGEGSKDSKRCRIQQIAEETVGVPEVIMARSLSQTPVSSLGGSQSQGSTSEAAAHESDDEDVSSSRSGNSHEGAAAILAELSTPTDSVSFSFVP